MKMKTLMNKKTLFIAFLCTVLFSCKDDENVLPEENDEEVITTMKLSFIPVGGGSTKEFMFDDADGPGGNAPIKQTINLQPNKTYKVSLILLNKTKNPVDTISNEVKAESASHRIYYEPTGSSNIAVSNLDNDSNGIPLGLQSDWATTAAASGKIKITLRHYPSNPPNKAAGDPVNSTKSSTDIEVDFDTIIQ
jgi:hypothetical protein